MREILEMSSKPYDAITVGMAGIGISLMVCDSRDDLFKPLPWTGLLAWLAGLSGMMSSVLKLSADSAAGFK